MAAISGLAEAAVYVSDLDRAVQFYREVLGLPLANRFGDACFLQTGPNATIILFDVARLSARQSVIPSHGAQGPGHIALSIERDQYAWWRERLEAAGVEIEHEQRWPLGTRSLYFRDPDGNSLELIESDHYPTIWRSLSDQ